MTYDRQAWAAHFKCSVSNIDRLRKEGMPTDSLEAAEAWRAPRMARSRSGMTGQRKEIVIDPESVRPDDDFDQTVERHRELKEAARQRYIAARDSGDAGGQESKLYATYQNILKTLVTVEREALARKIESRELIKTSLAIDKFARIMGEIKADLLGLPVQIASQCNPNNPGAALKVIDKHVNALLAKWSQQAGIAESEIEQPADIGAPDLDGMGVPEGE